MSVFLVEHFWGDSHGNSEVWSKAIFASGVRTAENVFVNPHFLHELGINNMLCPLSWVIGYPEMLFEVGINKFTLNG